MSENKKSDGDKQEPGAQPEDTVEELVEPEIVLNFGHTGELEIHSEEGLLNPCGGGMDTDGVIQSAGPEGPIFKLCANSSNPRVVFSRVNLSATASYAKHGRSDSATRSAAGGGNQQTVRLNTDFRNTFQGGDVRFSVSFALSNGQSGSRAFTGSIKGENPSKAEVRNQTAKLELAVLSYVQTRFRQFDAGQMPFVGTRGGQVAFGLLAIVNPNSAQIWNWKENLAQGALEHAAGVSAALAYPQQMRDAGHNVPDFSRKQLSLEVYHRYGVLRSYWIPQQNKWVKNPAGGAFAEDCWKVEKAVRAGNPPADWT